MRWGAIYQHWEHERRCSPPARAPPQEITTLTEIRYLRIGAGPEVLPVRSPSFPIETPTKG